MSLNTPLSKAQKTRLNSFKWFLKEDRYELLAIAFIEKAMKNPNSWIRICNPNNGSLESLSDLLFTIKNVTYEKNLSSMFKYQIDAIKYGISN